MSEPKPCLQQFHFEKIPLITFVMPTSGRDEFSERFVHHLHKQTNEFALVTEDSRDANFAAYYAKVNRMLALVKSPYAMMVDNDDLVMWDGVRSCLKVLNGQPQFVAAGGRIEGFRIRGNGPYGKINYKSRLYSPFDDPEIFDHTDKADRIVAGFDNSWTFYAVHRTEILVKIWREIADMNISNMQLHEKFAAMRLLSLGKVWGGDVVAYVRQYGTSGTFAHRDSFPMRLMTDNFSRDRDAILNRLGLEPHDRAVLIRAWADWWEAWFNRNYGPAAAARKWAKRHYPRLVQAIKNRPALRGRYDLQHG